VKRFEFTLQRTMDWRQRKAEVERSELERLHGVRSTLSESRSELRQELQELGHQRSKTQACSAEELHQHALFTRSLFNLDRRLAGEENVCDSNIESQVKKCVSADRDHRLLEKLRDKGHRLWLAACERETEETAAENWNSVHGRRLPPSE
jgi:hypothetical protein